MIIKSKLSEFKDKPIFLESGDMLILSYTDEEGTRELGTHTFTEPKTVTHVGYFEFEHEFGLTEGFGGFFGNDL